MSTMNKNFSNLMWVEKYRPEKLDEVIDQKEIIRGLKNLINNPEEIPHLLFAGLLEWVRLLLLCVLQGGYLERNG